MSATPESSGRAVRVLLAASAGWLVLAIFPLARDVTLIKVVGFQLLVLMAAIVAWRQSRAGSPLRVHAPLAVPVLVLAAALLIAVPFATNPGHGLMELARLAPGIVAFFLAMHAFRDRAHLEPFAAAATLALTLASLYGLVQWFGWDPFPWAAATAQDLDLLRRAPSTYGNPNLAAHAALLGIPLALLLNANGWRWALACLPVLAAHLALTATRGAYAGLLLAAVLVVAAWGCSRIRPKAANGAVMASLLITGLLAGMAGAAVMGVTHLRTGSPIPSDTTLTLRFHSTFGAAEMIRARPLVGHGPGHFVVDNVPYWTALEQARFADIGRRNDRVHNEPLDLAVQGGLAAGAAYLALLLTAIVMSLRMAAAAGGRPERATGLAFAAVFTAFAVDGLFGFNLHAPVSGGLFWMLLGAFAGLHAHPLQQLRDSAQRRVRAAMPAAAAVSLVLGAMAFGASVFAMRGDGARFHGEPDAAYGQYELAARLNPWDWRVQQAMGTLNMEQAFYASAAQHFDAALALHPDDPYSLGGKARAHTLHASNLLAEGMDGAAEAERKALEAVEQLAARCPPLAEGALVRATIKGNELLRTRGASEEVVAEAEAAAEELLAIGSEYHRQAWQLLANVRAAQGDYPATAKAFAMALTHEPGNERTWHAFDGFAHGTASYAPYLDSIRWREERLRLEQAGASAERATMALRRAEGIASGYEAAPQVSAAFADAARLEPLRPGLWPAFYGFARSHDGQMHAFRTVVTEIGRALEAEWAPSPPPEALPVLIAGLAAQGRQAMPSAAENCYRFIAFGLEQQQRSPAVLREEFGWTWFFLVGEAERLPVERETTGLVFLRLGMTAALLGDDEGALSVLERAEPMLSPEPRAECLRHIGMAAMRLGRQDTALEALARGVQLAPQDLGLRLDQARALAAAGQTSAARAAYAQILATFQFDPENRARLEAEMAQLDGN